jgi:hypothetical protein
VCARAGNPSPSWSVLAFFNTWARWEDASGYPFNPLATTREEPGSVPGNSAGVQIYPDQGQGEQGTFDTLNNGYYPDILSALVSNAPAATWLSHPAIAAQVDTWGTHGFASLLRAGGPLTDDYVAGCLPSA